MGEGFISILHGKRIRSTRSENPKCKGTGSFVPKSTGTMREGTCGGF
jgi:hypothetical protein